MTEPTLESLAARVTELERKIAGFPPDVIAPTRSWQSVAGMFTGSEFMKEVDAEIIKLREVERDAAHEGALE